MATTADFGPEERAMQGYFREGRERALALPNRGPARFDAAGRLHPEIIAAYEEYGFYVLEGLVAAAELAELESDYLDLVERLPASPGARLDRQGRPALGADLEMPIAHWAKPLSDPQGGTEKAMGRHPVKMFEPKPAADLPEQVVFTVVGALQLSDAFLRLYGHPDVLAVAAAINGDDFVPFQEGILIKRPGEGRSFAWHQDGVTHWDSSDWDQHVHGFNLMVQLYRSTPANGVWFVPGTHRQGRADIRSLAERAGSDRLEGAVPLVCGPGDAAISNRQIVHGSFANTSPDIRVTLSMGFHPRRAVVGARGIHSETLQPVTFDAEFVRRRAEMIGYAIDARRQARPDETPFTYRPHADAGETYRWDDAARQAVRDYHRYDLRT
jgi:ectoine hydroxylase-related dioxygenase (phytanoyl-CoA dioxygenase family)